MTDDGRPSVPKPTRQERLQEQLRANLKRRKDQARARREPRSDAAPADDTPPSSDDDMPD